MTSTRTACRRPRAARARSDAGLTSGHGAEANTFTVLGVAYTDKGGPGGIAPLTGRAEAILQPKIKQAEFFASTGRVAGGSTEGTAGAITQNTTDAIGGGLNLTGIEDGDYVSYKPVSLKTSARCASASRPRPTRRRSRSASTRRRARSWPRRRRSRRPAPRRPTRRSSCRSRPPAGTHELFFVFRNPGASGSLLNVNWIEFVGKGAAITAPPAVTVNATRVREHAADRGLRHDRDRRRRLRSAHLRVGLRCRHARLDAAGPDAPLHRGRHLHGDPDGDRRRRRRHRGPDADQRRPRDRHLPDRLSRRLQRHRPRRRLESRQARSGPDGRRRPRVDPDPGRRPLPDDQHGHEHHAAARPDRRLHDHRQDQEQGPGAVPAGRDHRLRQRQQLHQARPHGDQHATATNTEKFEFINEVNATARNHRTDGTANLAATFAQDFYVRMVSDGTTLTGQYSTDGQTWTQRGPDVDGHAGQRAGRVLRALQRRGHHGDADVRLVHDRGPERAAGFRTAPPARRQHRPGDHRRRPRRSRSGSRRCRWTSPRRPRTPTATR